MITGTLLYIISFLLIKGAAAQQQRLIEAPVNQTVVEGQRAVLRCRVADRRGLLQWTKDGFALGFDRQIPGFPRYRVSGTETLGVHDLVIDSARLDDDAEYQCQVGPAHGQPALLGVAHLSLIIPPKPTEIEGYRNESQVRVAHTQASLALVCLAREGKPAPTFRWFRNGHEITSQMTSEGVVSIETTTMPSQVGGGKLITGRSKLTIRPRDLDNEALYRCEAKNEAMSEASSITVQLSVQHPPGAPEIEGYSSDQVVRAGDMMRLICVSRGGNPLAQVYWFKNGVVADLSYVSGNGRSLNEFVFELKPSDNGAVYRCDASNQVSVAPLSAQVVLNVQFAPEKVTISGNLNAKAGDSVLLTCESAISNPPATLSWLTRARHVSGGKSSTKPSSKGGYITTSELRVTLTERDDEIMYQCHGTSEALGKTVVDTAVLKVMYPPEKPTISGYQPGQSIYSGAVLSMTCISVGGNPPASLSWWKGSEELQATPRITGNLVSAELSILLKPEDNGEEYRCTATNPATPAPLESRVKLSVSFPPKSLTIALSPEVVRVSQPVNITCRSSSSNPASKLSWWKDGEKVAGQGGATQVAEFGGMMTESWIEVTPRVADHHQIYACRATNEIMEHAVSDAITLNVLYKPYFSADVPTLLNVVEKESAVLTAVAIGNPSNIKYTWQHGDKPLDLGLDPVLRRRRDAGSRFLQDGATLTVKSVAREDSGNYTVVASNSEGSSKHVIELNVQYPAKITSLETSVMVNIGEKITLECAVSANPSNLSSLITWTRVGDVLDMTRATIDLDIELGISKLVIAEAVKADSGQFFCTADNGVGEPAVRMVELVVKYAPEVDKSPVYSKAAADKGSTAVLKCKADGVPAVEFLWFRDSVELKGKDSMHSVLSTRTLGSFSYETELQVFNTTNSDYGKYLCVARNELGEDNFVITLDGTSKPDSPYDLTFLNSTHNSITLSWQPGFDGGAPVHYQVHYKEVGGEGLKHEDVSPPTATKYTIKGLNSGAEYEMTVTSINRLGSSSYTERPLKAKTRIYVGEDVSLVIILTVCIIGGVLLALNVLLILFFIRRRRKKFANDDDGSSSVSQANTLEMVNTPGTDDFKSYTTYDQHSIDYIDDKMGFDRPDDGRYTHPSHMYPTYTTDYPPPPAYLPPPDTTSTLSREGGLYPLGENGYRGPYSAGSLPRRREATPTDDDDIYADQLRKMQLQGLTVPTNRGLGSTTHIPANGYVPPGSYRSTPSGTGPSRGYTPQHFSSFSSTPNSLAYSDMNPTDSSKQQQQQQQQQPPPPPELRGHLV